MRAYKECPHTNNQTRRAYHQRRQIFQLLRKEHYANHVENAVYHILKIVWLTSMH